MIDALYISENALRASQEWINKISHNVANINTPSFKRQDVHFADLVGGGVVLDKNSAGLGTHIERSYTDFGMGQLKQTNRQLDFAIDGDGFLEVVMQSGDIAYTKNGQLAINEDRKLMLIDGTEIADDVYIPPNAEIIKLDQDGRVLVVTDNGLNTLEVGQLTLVNFANSSALEAIGNGRYVGTSESGGPMPSMPGENGSGRVVQGFIEMSNVELVDEMSNVMLAQRAYQINARLLQVTDQVLETINNLRR